MRYFRLVVATLLVGAVSGIAWVKVTHAQVFQQNVASSQTVNSSLYSVGKSININGTINGDVYCAGQDVIIDATVHGDILCAARTVSISGRVDGSVRVAAQTATVDASVGRNVSIAAQTLNLDSSAHIGQDVSLVAQTADLEGNINRDIVARVTTMTIGDQVGRNVNFAGNQLTLDSHAHVQGALTYRSPQKADMLQGSVVADGINYSASSARRSHLQWWSNATLPAFIYMLVAFFVLAMALLLIVPQGIHHIGEEAARHLGRTLLWGLGMLLLPPVLFALLIVTVVGIPLAFVFLAAVLFVALLSGPVTAYYTGSLVLPKSNDVILRMLVGVVILTVLLFIPFVNILAFLGTYIVGTGAIMGTLQKRLPRPVYRIKTS